MRPARSYGRVFLTCLKNKACSRGHRVASRAGGAEHSDLRNTQAAGQGRDLRQQIFAPVCNNSLA